MESLIPLPLWLSRWKKQNTPAAEMLENLRTCGLGLVLEKRLGDCDHQYNGDFRIWHSISTYMIKLDILSKRRAGTSVKIMLQTTTCWRFQSLLARHFLGKHFPFWQPWINNSLATSGWSIHRILDDVWTSKAIQTNIWYFSEMLRFNLGWRNNHT